MACCKTAYGWLSRLEGSEPVLGMARIEQVSRRFVDTWAGKQRKGGGGKAVRWSSSRARVTVARRVEVSEEARSRYGHPKSVPEP